jgi:hypothetical protein
VKAADWVGRKEAEAEVERSIERFNAQDTHATQRTPAGAHEAVQSEA